MLLTSAAFMITRSQKAYAGTCVAVAVVVPSIGLHAYTRFEASTPRAKQARYAEEALYLDKDIASMWGERPRERAITTRLIHTKSIHARERRGNKNCRTSCVVYGGGGGRELEREKAICL